MKKIVKIGIILVILFSIMAQLNICNAALIDIGTYEPSDLGEEKTLVDKANVIASAIRNIGIVIAVISFMVIGIKAMVGSAEEKADYKKSMIPYLVGAVVLFGASAIAGVVVSLSQNITA